MPIYTGIASLNDFLSVRETLGASALQAGLVDECRIFLNPVAVGGGLRFLPDGLHLRLELQDERRFRRRVVYLSYRYPLILPGSNAR